MKVRNGFVSNSSSSSFIIGSIEVMTKERLEKIANIQEGSPFESLFKEIVDIVFRNLGEPIKTVKEFEKENGYVSDKVKELFAKGFIFYSGGFSSEGEPAEMMLCGTPWNYESDDIYIEKEGDY